MFNPGDTVKSEVYRSCPAVVMDYSDFAPEIMKVKFLSGELAENYPEGFITYEDHWRLVSRANLASEYEEDMEFSNACKI